MSTTKKSKKILIINWKWRFLTHLNNNTLKNLDLSRGIESGAGVFYKEFTVKASKDYPDALVVATSIYNDRSTKSILYQLIDHYYQLDNDVILLMHRPNLYKEDDIESILQRYDRLCNCTLFEGGRDYIYYPSQESGLLDDLGNFFVGTYNGRFIETINEQEEIVQQPYFDRVWNYYVGEFEIKVLAFKEELFDSLFPFFLPDASESIPHQTIIDVLQQDIDRLGRDNRSPRKFLWYRLKSFLGMYKDVGRYDTKDFDQKAQARIEIAMLKELEKINKTSYLFDASLVNIQEKTSGLKEDVYSDVKSILEAIFFGKEEDTQEKIITKTELKLLAAKLDLLTKVIPGLID